MPLRIPSTAALALARRASCLVRDPVAWGLLLHAGAWSQALHPWSSFTVAFVAWSCMPYFACLAVRRRRPTLASGGALAALAVDLCLAVSVLWYPATQTTGLALVLLPLINLLVFVPLGMLLAHALRQPAMLAK